MWKDIWLTLSNLLFILPAFESIWRGRFTRFFVYISIIFFSSSYHMCDSFPLTCFFSFEIHIKLDFFFAQLVIPLSALYLINFGYFSFIEKWSIYIYAIAIAVTLLLDMDQRIAQFLISGSAFIILIFYWVIFGFPRYNYINLSLGISMTVLAVCLFFIQDKFVSYYWASHSLWHVLGALGQFFLLKAKNKQPVYKNLEAVIH